MFLKIQQIGHRIDKADDEEDGKELKNLIKECKNILENSQDKAIIYYFLANIYSGLRKIKHKLLDKNVIWQLEQKELFKEIYYLRKAIQADDFNGINIEYRNGVFTNLANAFDDYGRPILAINYYNKSLELKHFNINYSMTLVNKARCLKNYAKLNYDWSHKSLILRKSYFYYKNGYKQLGNYIKKYNHDVEFYKNIKNTIKSEINNLEKILTKEWLKENIDLNDYKLRNEKNEKTYRYWVLRNKLFLNPINDLGDFNIATHDPLNLPNLKTSIADGFPKYITYFNQIKQEYISNRALLYEGLKSLTKKFYDKEISVTDDYDYNLYNTNIEKIKLSFRGFYSLFDKIAYFINEYFRVEMKKNEVDFRKIWHNNKKQVNSKSNNLENLTLRGLYLISKELYFNKQDEDYTEALEPEAKKINEIRNHLEHKFIMIKMLDVNSSETISNRDRVFYITQDELENKTINLAKLIREAIIYLSFAVHIEESKKESKKESKDNCAIINLNKYKGVGVN